MVRLFILFLILISSFALADDSKFKIFKDVGKFSHISFKPENSPLSFEYDVYYYIPSKLVGKKDLKALVFMHGGGASTTTRLGSTTAISYYQDDFIRWAEELDYVLIMPSGSGQNWSSHLLNYFRELNTLIRTDLPVDPDRIGLTGHSMGAMGITRSTQWLVDQYAFFLPMAGGIQDSYRKDIYLKTYFNTTYVHLQGRYDHFQEFLTRCLKQEADLKRLEALLGVNSGFSLIIYEGNHNYDLTLTKNKLKTLFETTKRDLYQKNLHGVFYHEDRSIETQWTYGEKIYLAPRSSYFWIKALDFYESKKVIGFTANVVKNEIHIKMDLGVKLFRVYLSDKFINTEEPIRIYVNKKLVFSRIPTNAPDMAARESDPNFIYESYADIFLLPTP